MRTYNNMTGTVSWKLRRTTLPPSTTTTRTTTKKSTISQSGITTTFERDLSPIQTTTHSSKYNDSALNSTRRVTELPTSVTKSTTMKTATNIAEPLKMMSTKTIASSITTTAATPCTESGGEKIENKLRTFAYHNRRRFPIYFHRHNDDF